MFENSNYTIYAIVQTYFQTNENIFLHLTHYNKISQNIISLKTSIKFFLKNRKKIYFIVKMSRSNFLYNLHLY